MLRILFVDDKKSDVRTVPAWLNLNAWISAVSSDWVQVPAEFGERLRTESYDVIVCDYSMPGWTGMEALDLLIEANRGIPFILATFSTLDEEMTDAFIRKRGRIRLHR